VVGLWIAPRGRQSITSLPRFATSYPTFSKAAGSELVSKVSFFDPPPYWPSFPQTMGQILLFLSFIFSVDFRSAFQLLYLFLLPCLQAAGITLPQACAISLRCTVRCRSFQRFVNPSSAGPRFSAVHLPGWQFIDVFDPCLFSASWLRGLHLPCSFPSQHRIAAVFLHFPPPHHLLKDHYPRERFGG